MKTQTFEEIYENVPVEQKAFLQEFRANHPYKELAVVGTSWRYISCGQGSRTLLLLPGGFATADMWLQVISALEGDYRIIAPDAYALQGTFAMDEVCRALVSILDAEGVQKATVIGISAGGGVAQWFIQEYPLRVEDLVLSHCGIVGAEKARRRPLIFILLKVLPFSVTRQILISASSGNYPPSSDWDEFARAFFRELGSDLRRETVLRFLGQGLETHRTFVFRTEALDDWPGRILILASADDQVTIGNLEELKARYPRATTHIFDEGGHHTLLLFPTAYLNTIKVFLDELRK